MTDARHQDDDGIHGSGSPRSFESASASPSPVPWDPLNPSSNRRDKTRLDRRPLLFICAFVVLLLVTTLFFFTLFAGFGSPAVPDRKKAASSSVPDYYQTTPDVYRGPTKTAAIAPFLAQTNSAPFGASSWVPNEPLETGIPIVGNTNNSNVFQLMGHLSSYFPNPVGFGVDEYPMPPGSIITKANLLHRHGSRYPTSQSNVVGFGARIRNATESGITWTGELSFLNDWSYTLGAEILVPRGRQELFDSGVLFYYYYGHLYNTSTHIVARTTTQDRMLKSAGYFMAGFFGLEWTQNASLVPIIEKPNANNSLAGYFQCNDSGTHQSEAGSNASTYWTNIYLADATRRLKQYTGNYNWTIADSYAAQTMCPYETVAYGYSNWCNLFTYDDWVGFEYSIDLSFQGNDGFLSPTGRGVGIGYVEELYARLQGHVYELAAGHTQVNVTLSSDPATFPINQDLYMDFSHDTNIYSILTALGMMQFSDQLSNSSITPNRNVTVSHITPFGARVVWEQITAPQPLKATRPTGTNPSMSDYYDEGNETQYIHMTISQRTVPLGFSYPECGLRDDGWCEFNTYLKILSTLLETARYDYSCFGNYTVGPWGSVTNGVPDPPSKRDIEATSLRDMMGSGLVKKRNSEVWDI